MKKPKKQRKITQKQRDARLGKARAKMREKKKVFSARGFLAERGHEFFTICDTLTHKSSMLRNLAQRIIDDYYEKYGTYAISDYIAAMIGLPTPYQTTWVFGEEWSVASYKGHNIYDLGVLYHLVKNSPEFRCGENTKVLKKTLSQAQQEMTGWIAVNEDFHTLDDAGRKRKYKNGEPRKPGYRNEEKGRYIVTFPSDAVSRSANKGKLTLASTGIIIPDYFPNQPVAEVKVRPDRNGYEIIVVYRKTGVIVPDLSASHDKYAGIDLGVVMLAMLACNDPNVRSAMVGAGTAEYICRKLNHQMGKLVDALPRDVKNSKAINHLLKNHRNRMKTFMHTVSKRIVEWCLVNKVGVLVVGSNSGWKQRSKLGRRGNRRFQSIPFATLRFMLQYKCERAGIVFMEQQESHTSKTSFLDNEEICHHDEYLGKRTPRGRFTSKDGMSLHSDQNGALNILRKAIGDKIFSDDRKLYTRLQPHHIPLLKAVTS